MLQVFGLIVVVVVIMVLVSGGPNMANADSKMLNDSKFNALDFIQNMMDVNESNTNQTEVDEKEDVREEAQNQTMEYRITNGSKRNNANM